MSTRPVVLVVDDDPHLLALIVRALRTVPADVLGSAHPREALEVLKRDEVAVLVADYEMPELTGIELAKAARGIQPETVRILLTGQHTFETALLGINEAEIFRYVSKPVEPAALRRVVLEALDRNTELRSVSAVRAATSRRSLIMNALEAEYPGITRVARAPDGAYLVMSQTRDQLAELDLEVLYPVGRR